MYLGDAGVLWLIALWLLLYKAESYLFYFLLFSIPFEVKKLLWQWGGFKIEWTSGFLWTSDFLIIALLVLWFFRFLGNEAVQRQTRGIGKYATVMAWGFFGAAVLSSADALVPAISAYQLLKLAEFMGLFFYVKHNFGTTFNFTSGLLIIVLSGFIQSIIAVVQLVKQGASGLWFIGEPLALSPDTPGIAVFLVDGIKFMRAYGTTPHPNVLAIFLFVALFGFYWLRTAAGHDRARKIWETRRNKIIGLVIYSVMFFAFFGHIFKNYDCFLDAWRVYLSVVDFHE